MLVSTRDKMSVLGHFSVGPGACVTRPHLISISTSSFFQDCCLCTFCGRSWAGMVYGIDRRSREQERMSIWRMEGVRVSCQHAGKGHRGRSVAAARLFECAVGLIRLATPLLILPNDQHKSTHRPWTHGDICISIAIEQTKGNTRRGTES
jgi:hypothetical protein